jgi:hypothetical protein
MNKKNQFNKLGKKLKNEQNKVLINEVTFEILYRKNA